MRLVVRALDDRKVFVESLRRPFASTLRTSPKGTQSDLKRLSYREREATRVPVVLGRRPARGVAVLRVQTLGQDARKKPRADSVRESPWTLCEERLETCVLWSTPDRETDAPSVPRDLRADCRSSHSYSVGTAVPETRRVGPETERERDRE